MRNYIKACVALAAVSVFASKADAATVIVQANAGRPLVSFGTTTWAATSSAAGWDVVDGRTIERFTAGNWATPIPITTTNGNWNAVAHGGGLLSNRICSYTSAGAFSGCGAFVGVGAVSTVFVPLNGSVRTNSSFAGGLLASLFHIRAFN